MAKSKVPTSLGGGDQLARGSATTHATFPSCAHVDERRWDFIWLTEEQFIEKHGKRAFKKAQKGEF